MTDAVLMSHTGRSRLHDRPSVLRELVLTGGSPSRCRFLKRTKPRGLLDPHPGEDAGARAGCPDAGALVGSPEQTEPKKVRAPLTIDQMAAAAAKRAATRAARHTMGPKQKQKVKGTITTIVSPPAAAAPATIKPAPVASAPNPGTTAGAGTSPVANAPTPVAGASAAAASHGTLGSPTRLVP